MKITRKPPETPASYTRGGRPSREDAERRRIMALGVDPALVDPRRILAGIAIDTAVPATARVAALRLLLASGAGASLLPASLGEPVDDEVPADELTRRALEILATRGRPN